MNRYIIPICIYDKSKIYNMLVNARSYNDCKEKIMYKLIEEFDLPNIDDYDDFIDELYNRNILIGEIKDIETL